MLPAIAGLQYHLDASQAGSLTLGSSSSVSAWNDISGAGVAFTQSTSCNQPTYLASGINGLGTVSFNGSSDVLNATTSTSQQTVFIVDQVNGYVCLGGIWGEQSPADVSIRMNSASTWQNGSGNTNNNDFTDGGSMVINGVLQSGNGTFTIGTPQILEGVSSGVDSWVSALGLSQAERYYNGEIGEVLVYSGTLTTAQQQAVEAYLNYKWLSSSGSRAGEQHPCHHHSRQHHRQRRTLDLGTTNQTVASLAGVAGSIVNLESQTLTIGGSSTTTFAGTMSGAGSLVVGGSGVLTLSGANTYSGGTTISAGTLQFAQTAAMPASGTVSVASGATLAVNAGGSGEFTSATSAPAQSAAC